MISKFVNLTSEFMASIVDDVPGTYIPQDDLETSIAGLSMRTIIGATALLIALVALSMSTITRFPKLKMPLFALILITILGSTLVLVGSTVYLNTHADSGGPVHWHSDIEFWACGNEIELRDPVGFSNKIGTWTLHEHNDHRIHLEGVVVDAKIDASLGKFMYVIGGTITEDALIIPVNPADSNLFENDVDGDGPSAMYPELVEPYVVNDGENGRFARFLSGQTCGDQYAEVQTFVYRYNEDENTYEQFKLDDPDQLALFGVEKINEYSISENPNVPPGDCVIFEFDVPKDKTDKLCEQYGIRDVVRCVDFGVSESQMGICKVTQINYDINADYRSNDPNTEAETPTESAPPPGDQT